MRASAQRRKAEHPARFRARDAVSKALKAGVLQKPAACQWCGTTAAPRLVAHHESYDRADWLKVAFICDRCHARHHAEEQAA